MIFTGTNLSK